MVTSICLELGVNVLHMTQLTKLLSHLLLLHKIHSGLTFLVMAYPGFPGKEAVMVTIYTI